MRYQVKKFQWCGMDMFQVMDTETGSMVGEMFYKKSEARQLADRMNFTQDLKEMHE